MLLHNKTVRWIAPVILALMPPFITACHRPTSPPALTPTRATPGPKRIWVELFVDQTGSINIPGPDGKVTSRLPGMVARLVDTIRNTDTDAEVIVQIRPIVSNSNTEQYVLPPHTFGKDGPAADARYQRDLVPIITRNIVAYQQQHINGTDIFGALRKLTTVTEGMPQKNSACIAVFLSDLIHEQAPDVGSRKFATPVHIYSLLANDDGDPNMCERARTAFRDHVTAAGGTYTPLASPDQIEEAIKEASR